MAGVKIDSGQFKLMRNIDISHQPSRSDVYAAWSIAFNQKVPDAIEHLADVIEDVYAYRLWEDNYLNTPEEFFERIGIFGLNLDEPAKLIKQLRTSKSFKKNLERQMRVQAEANIKSRKQQAEEENVSERTIQRDRNSVMTDNVSPKEPRKRIVLQLSQYTSPQTAAEKIRLTFGDEFADALKQLL